MTSWGCTPTCRGFDHFYGFYNAFNDYFTHHVGAGLDFRDDVTPVTDQTGQYACATDPAGQASCSRCSNHPGTKCATRCTRAAHVLRGDDILAIFFRATIGVAGPI